MAEHKRFHLKSLDDLSALAAQLGVEIPHQQDTSILFDAVPLAGGLTLPNRFAVHPMEGFDADPSGTPGELTARRYIRYAAGGAGLIWFEACSVVLEGRSNPGQLCLHNENVDAFTRLVERTRQAAREFHPAGVEPVLVLQMTHSGRYSKPTKTPAPMIAHHSPILDPLHKLPADYPLVTDAYLDELQDRFVECARLAARAGFDGVDIKSCHRYLFAELHASFTRENSRYGGSFENRTRMIREITARIVAEVKEVFVTTRLNVYDAIPYPYGFGVSREDKFTPDLAEPLELIAELKKLGMPILNHSIGNPYYEPHFGRPYDLPIAGFKAPPSHPLENVAKFLKITRSVQESQPGLPIVGSGYSWLRQFIPQVAAAVVSRGWATVIGQGRNSFAYPDSIRDLRDKGYFDKNKVCVTCSGCTQIMRDGGQTGCIVRDSEIYGKNYREGRRKAPDVLLADAERCLDCETPNCQQACPAGVEVPRFVKAYAKGDIEASYKILKEKNLFPEMCAYVCPVEEQCEGSCMRKTMGEAPISIHEIQKSVAQRARALGLARVVLGAATGRKMAVIGAGPAGLACTAALLQEGHSVDLYEKAASPGGTPALIIPPYRLGGETAVEEIRGILDSAQEAGRFTLRCGEGLSAARTVKDFSASYDGVFLGIGLGRSTGLPGTEKAPEGVMDAVSFLWQCKNGEAPTIPASVCVLGAGNTAIDAAVTARRLGAQDVSIIYRRSFQEMPAWSLERNEALEAGVQFLIMTQPLGYTSEKGRVTGLRTVRTVLGAQDASGRRTPEVLPGSEAILPAGLVIEALGQEGAADLGAMLSGITLDRRGRVVVEESTGRTNLINVYAGGDLVNGGATAVRAVADGMKAAAAMSSAVACREGV